MGFLRLATNPKVLGNHTVSMVEAWRGFDLMLSDSIMVAFLIRCRLDLVANLVELEDRPRPAGLEARVGPRPFRLRQTT